MSKKEQG